MIKKYFLLFILLGAFTAGSAQTTLDTALNFSCKDINGNTHELYDILAQGKMVVVDFFSTSCGPCATYAPHIQDSYEHFGYNSQNVYFLGIAWGDDNHGVHIFDSTYGVTYPSISGVQGNGNPTILAYNIQSYPTVVLIGTDSLIIEKHIWPPTTDRIDSILIANGGFTTGNPSQTLMPSTGIDISLFPIPAKQYVNVMIDSKEEQFANIQVFDLTGRVVHTKGLELLAGKNMHGLDVSHLEKGNYILTLQSIDGMHIGRKLIIN